jgi:hypothetical protein
MSLILIIIALLWFSIWGAATGSTGSEQTCSASTGDNISRCGPETSNGAYALPSEGAVIRSVVNNGPISPEYQAGYEIEIDADGVVTISEFQGEADPTVRTVVITLDEVQSLLTDFERCGLYYLPQAAEFEGTDLPVGGPVSLLQVHLRNGDWEVSGDMLSQRDAYQLSICQNELARRFDVTLSDQIR